MKNTILLALVVTLQTLALGQDTKISELPLRASAAGDEALIRNGTDNFRAPVGDEIIALQASDTATAAAIGLTETTTQLNARDVISQARANHTGTQAIATVAGLQALLDKQVSYSATVLALATAAPTDQSTWITEGYYAAGGSGANMYWYDATSTATCDGGFVLDGVGGDNSPASSALTYSGSGTGRFLALDQTIARVRQFGAKGDDTTDDYYRIQAAINANAASGEVVFENGEYMLSLGLAIAGRNQYLRGTGTATGYENNTSSGDVQVTPGVVLRFTGGTVGIDFVPDDIGIDVERYARISDIFIDGGSVLTEGLQISGGVKIKSCTITRCATGIAVPYGLNSGAMQDVTCTENSVYGMRIYADKDAPQVDNTIFEASNCRFRVNGASNVGAGVRIDNGQMIAWRSCIFESNRANGLQMFTQDGASGAPIQNMLFSGCWFENNGEFSTIGTDYIYAVLSDREPGAPVEVSVPRHIVFDNCMFSMGGNQRALRLIRSEALQFRNCSFRGGDTQNHIIMDAGAIGTTFINRGLSGVPSPQGDLTIQGTGTRETTLNASVMKLMGSSHINGAFRIDGLTTTPAINSILRSIDTIGTLDWRTPPGHRNYLLLNSGIQKINVGPPATPETLYTVVIPTGYFTATQSQSLEVRLDGLFLGGSAKTIAVTLDGTTVASFVSSLTGAFSYRVPIRFNDAGTQARTFPRGLHAAAVVGVARLDVAVSDVRDGVTLALTVDGTASDVLIENAQVIYGGPLQ